MTHLPNTPEVLYCFPEAAGQHFMPSNGTDGMVFMDAFCDNCIHQHPDPDKTPQCDDILLQSLIGEQPAEWIFNKRGWPICTKWKFWDWNGRDGDDINEPPPPEPFNPRQLIFPYDLVGLLVGYDDFAVFPTCIIERELIEN